jgi:HlyD family secretion protein
MAEYRKTGGILARNRWLAWTAGIIFAVVLLASFMSREDIVTVRAAKAQRGMIRSVISTNGKIEPLENFEAHAPVGTTVKRLLVKEGDAVKEGQLMVELDDASALSEQARAMAQVRGAQANLSAIASGGTQEEVLTTQADLVKARAAHETADRNLEAMKRLLAQGAASPGEVKAAEAESARTAADVKLLEDKLKERYSKPEIAKAEAQKDEARTAYDAASDIVSQLNIRAPFDGIVYSLPVKQGAYVNPGDLILQEANLSQVLVRAYVDEPDVGKLAAGQKIELTWDAIPGRVWQGSVNSIPTSVKLRGTRTVGETTCIVENRDFKLLPNVNVGVTIVTAEHPNALTIPREAVRQDESKPYVYQIVNGELQRRDIDIVLSNLTQVEINNGIPENAQVAVASTNPSKPLKDRLSVKVVP